MDAVHPSIQQTCRPLQSRGGAGSKRQGEQSSRGAKRGQAKGAPERSEAKQRGQTALAVQGAIAAGVLQTLYCAPLYADAEHLCK